MDGDHGMDRCAAESERAMHAVLVALWRHRVLYEGILLKPNMILPGKGSSEKPTLEEVARTTVRVLSRAVPPAVPGIVFLSGGQSDQEATARLDAMNRLGPRPWEISFSYGRALQFPSLSAWKGRPENVPAAQRIFLHRARMNGAARFGRYTAILEREAAA